MFAVCEQRQNNARAQSTVPHIHMTHCTANETHTHPLQPKPPNRVRRGGEDVVGGGMEMHEVQLLVMTGQRGYAFFLGGLETTCATMERSKSDEMNGGGGMDEGGEDCS